MKIKEGYKLYRKSDRAIVLPTRSDLNQDLMITLNDTGAFLWEQLQKETDETALVAAVLDAYVVDKETAAKYVEDFVKKLRDLDILA